MERQTADVLLGELALERATAGVIKQFAQKMIIDHSRLNHELRRIALFKGILLPDELNSEDRASYAYLSTLSGTEFDEGYTAHILRGQRAAVAEFEEEADHAAHSEIQRFARDTLVTIREHLRLIQDTTLQLAVTAAATTRAIGFLY